MPDPMVLAKVPPRRAASAGVRSWWGRAVARSVEESTVGTSDLRAGRALARSGRVGAVMVLSTMASAAVRDDVGGRPVAQVKVAALEDWTGFVEELAREQGFLADLEAGTLSVELVEHADEAGVELLPGAADLETACECDAWIQPCVHALALLQQLTWHLDRDPWVLLLLRGRTREWVADAVAERQAAGLLAGQPDLGERERADAADTAAAILALAEEAPGGHGLADPALAAYDEEIGRLLP